MVMEVYGNNTEPSFDRSTLEEDEDELSLLRLKAFNRLKHTTACIQETILNFEKASDLRN